MRMTSTIAAATVGLFLALGAVPVFAGAAADRVAGFYAAPGSELEPESREFFTGEARRVLDASDRVWQEKEESCIGFVPSLDAQDFDDAEVARTLALDENVTGNEALVVARFDLFGEPREIEWSLREEGGDWKVSDIAGQHEGWRLSRLPCE